MTAPGESQMTHCRDCAHRLGSGCGCECCPWAGEAVLLAAGAIWDAHTNGPVPVGRGQWCNQLARAAVQAALPVVRAAAAAEERERLLNGPVAQIEPDPDQPGYNRGVFDVDAAIAQAVAAERERIADRVTEAAAAVTGGADAPVAVRSALMAVADLLRRGRG